MLEFLNLFVVLPYFLLIHIGMIAVVGSVIKSLANKRYSIQISKMKLITSAYGMIGGFVMLLIVRYFSLIDYPAPAIWANFLAVLLAGGLEELVPIKSSGHLYVFSWQYIVPYTVTGLIGGWGIGLFFEFLKTGLANAQKKKAERAGR